jgi:hypothetical protein
MAATAIVIAMSFVIVLRAFMSSPSVNKLVTIERVSRAQLLRRKRAAKTIIRDSIILGDALWIAATWPGALASQSFIIESRHQK